MKKLAIVFGAIFGLLLIAAIAVPLLVDVDKFRPDIVKAANEKLNGKLELGKLKLSLWGKVQVDVDGLALEDSAGKKVVEVREARFHLPLLSLISGSPEVRLSLKEPLIAVEKRKDGKYNLQTIAKSSDATGTSAGSPGSANGSKAEEKSSSSIPAIALKSRLTLILADAKVSYDDRITGDSYKATDVDFTVEDVSPTKPMPFDLTAKLDLVSKKTMTIKGPLKLQGKLTPKLNGDSLSTMDLEASLKLNDLEITDPGMIDKKAGVPLGLDVAGTVGTNEVTLSKFNFVLGEIVVGGNLSMKNEVVEMKVKSNEVDLSKLGSLFPMAKAYDLSGKLALQVEASGPTDKLNYAGSAKLSNVKLKHESMKQELLLNADTQFATDQIKDLTATLVGKEFDLRVKAAVQGFTAPRFQLSMTSNGMDLDALLKSHEKAAEARKQETQATMAGKAPESGKQGQAPAVDYNAMLAPLRDNKVAASASGTAHVEIKRLKTTGVVISPLKGDFALDKLVLSMKNFNMGLFEGAITGDANFNARPAKPEVSTKIKVAGLKSQAMVASQMPLARNSVQGVISGNLNIGGSGLNPNDITSNWKGGGDLTIKDAVFSSLDLGRQIRDGALGKLPEFAKSKIKVSDKLLQWQGEYDSVVTKFALTPGVFRISELKGTAHANKGLDLRGEGTVNLQTYAMEMNLDLIDTYNLTNGDSIAKDQRYGHFTLSPAVGGSLLAPRFDWGATMGKLAQSALKTRGMEELQKRIGDKIPGNAGGQKAEEAVKGVLKGIFRR